MLGFFVSMLGTVALADTATLGSDADTWVRDGSSSNYGSDPDMYILGGAGRVGYIRFDLSSLGSINITDATLTLSKVTGTWGRNDSLVTGRIAIVGLDNISGNTAQNWDETVLTSSNVGNEFVGGSGGAYPIDPAKSTNLDTENGANVTENVASGITFTLTGTDLVTFLQTRVDDDGLATLIATFPSSSSSKGFWLGTKENTTAAYRPVLQITYTPAAGPASSPDPGIGSTVSPYSVNLSWTPGDGALNSTVYLGTDANDVNSAYLGSTTGSTMYPGTLLPDTTYYWRVDTVTTSDTIPGQLWSFQTEAAIPPVNKSGMVVPADLTTTKFPWRGSLSYDTDQDPPEGSEDGGSVWGNGAFYSDVQGSAVGGGRDYTALRINLENVAICGRPVELGEIDSISYYTNMEPNSPRDWQLKIYTKPLDGQTSGWYGTRLNFTCGDNPDGNWDLWDTDTYTVSDIRDGQTGTMTYPNQLLSDIVVPYASQYIQFMDIIAGYATNSPACYSYLDAVTIKLKNGSEIKLDLEKIRSPQCSTHAAIQILPTSATLAGAVMDLGGAPCECRFLYTPEGGDTLSTPWSSCNASAGVYVNVDGLSDDMEYTFQMEIQNAAGSYLAGTRTFKTMALPQVDISSSSGGSVMEPGEGLFKVESQGDVLDVNAVAEGGYVFSRWVGTAVTQGKVADPLSATTSVQVVGALTLRALFKPVKIIWVTDTRDVDSDGIQDDQGWVDWLRSAGYVVDDQPDRYQKLGDEKDANDANDYVAELNSAALVIISRSSSSGSYASDANEIAAWNSIRTPIICLSAYHIRNNRWDWIDSGSAVSDNSLSYMSVPDANGPLFTDANVVDGMIDMVDTAIYGDGYQGTTFVDASSMGNAHVLGSYLLGYPWIAEWDADVAYYDGSSQIAGGKRMMFLAGTQETKSNGIYYPQGALNLTPDGQKVFLNAVDYMMNRKGTLGSDADTYFRDGRGPFGGEPYMWCASGSYSFVGYLRFDLSSLGGIDISKATLTLHTVSDKQHDSIVSGRFAVYGLANGAGNTAQDWDESTLTSANAGDEWDVDYSFTDSLSQGRVINLDADQGANVTEVVPNSSSGTCTLSGADLVSFLQARADADGLATLIITMRDSNVKYTSYGTKEADAAYRPVLEISYFPEEK